MKHANLVQNCTRNRVNVNAPLKTPIALNCNSNNYHHERIICINNKNRQIVQSNCIFNIPGGKQTYKQYYHVKHTMTCYINTIKTAKNDNNVAQTFP